MKKIILLLVLVFAMMWSAGKCDDNSNGNDNLGNYNGDADSDTDGDADGDTDGNADSDTDGDADSDTDGDADSDTDPDTDGDTGPCSEGVAETMCGEDCIFDPDQIDCEISCSNAITICARDDACGQSDACVAVPDQATCLVACGVSKTTTCLNLVFGCWGVSDQCDPVSECLNEHL